MRLSYGNHPRNDANAEFLQRLFASSSASTALGYRRLGITKFPRDLTCSCLCTFHNMMMVFS